MSGSFFSSPDFYKYALGIHQLNAPVTVQSRSGWLKDFRADGGPSLFRELAFKYTDSTGEVALSGSVDAFDDFDTGPLTDAFGQPQLRTSFRRGDVKHDLTTNFYALTPVATASTLNYVKWTATFGTPVHGADGKTAAAEFYDCTDFEAGSQVTTREWSLDGVKATTRFKYATEITGKDERVHAEWVDTTIDGLTAQPIKLTSPRAQTYTAGHHNFTEYFVFEPGRDPTLSAQQRAELKAADVRLVYGEAGLDGNGDGDGVPAAVGIDANASTKLWLVGFDGKRRLAKKPSVNPPPPALVQCSCQKTSGKCYLKKGATKILVGQAASCGQLCVNKAVTNGCKFP